MTDRDTVGLLLGFGAVFLFLFPPVGIIMLIIGFIMAKDREVW